MKIQNIAIGVSIIGLSLLAASPSFAQVKVGVGNNTRVTTGTTWSEQDLKIDETSQFNSTTDVVGKTQTLKVEAFGDVAAVNIKFDGKNLTGGGYATTTTAPDPVVIGLFSTYVEKYNATETKDKSVQGSVRSAETGYFNELSIDASSYLN